ncbi:hypothetical protein L3Q82_025683, partial [Scortum barcoo]
MGRNPLSMYRTLEKSLNEVHEMARQHLKAAQHRQKRLHDLRAQQHSYNVGDLVYRPKGHHSSVSGSSFSFAMDSQSGSIVIKDVTFSSLRLSRSFVL